MFSNESFAWQSKASIKKQTTTLILEKTQCLECTDQTHIELQFKRMAKHLANALSLCTALHFLLFF